jgi:hypothetical protein
MSPTGDADGDGLNNVTEATIDASARYQARVALVTAIVALISAILGPIVALWINSAQIDSQAKQFTVQTDADTGQSEAEFVRTQRSTAYTDYLTAFNNGTLDLLGAAGAFAGGGGTAEQFNEQTQKAINAVKDVTATFYKVRIVASKNADTKAVALYGEFGTWSGALLVAFGAILNGEQLNAEQQQLLLNTDDEYTTLLGLSNEFIEIGRDDMSADFEAKTKKS